MAKRSALTVLSVLSVFSLCGAEGYEARLPDFTLWARFTMGQVVSSPTDTLSYDFSFEREWLKSMDAGVRMTRRIGAHTLGRLNAGVGITYTVNQNTNKAYAEFLGKKIVPYLLDAAVQSSFGMCGNRDTLSIEFGYFPFKYDPQSTNLGEYLFRTGTYPGYIISGFENSYVDKPKLCGLHLSHTMHARGVLKQDVLLSTEMDVYPLHDLSLTYIATYAPHPIIEVGAGVELARFISVDERKTTPWEDGTFFNSSLPNDRLWIGYINPATGDTTKYTFRGTKVMGRITLDPKLLFRSSFFGKEDCKVYAEAALLGVKNYPVWYVHRAQRMPVMLGFNIPAFRLLDVLSLETEWYGCKYWNSQENIWKDRSPVPYTGQGVPDPTTWEPKTDDAWKWSLYGSKQINSLFRLSAQCACDHTPRFWYTPAPPSFVKYTEIMSRSRDWYYMMRISMYF
jgi:hypothetical protein